MKYSDTTQRVIGCAMRVHAALGNGFQEVIYQRALAIELEQSSISFEREYELDIYYKGMVVGNRRVDFLIDKNISVELKAIIELENVHLAQAKNYLEAFNLEVGLLINFGSISLQLKRIHNHKYTSQTFKA